METQYYFKQFCHIFRHVDDIDLFPGGMVETLVPGGLVGPTFACIIARQFRNSKIGIDFGMKGPTLLQDLH